MDFVVFRSSPNPVQPEKPFIEYYAGYEAESWAKSGPIFNKTITEKARFDETTANMALKQLTEMGHTVFVKQVPSPKKRRG